MSTLATIDSSTAMPLASEIASYAYSYPHKSSYRPLSPPVEIADAWRDEDVSRLSLYVHMPFCEMRCGFCNLFTQSQPASEIVTAYLATLHRQMQVVRRALPQATFSQFAIGGGTPTFLTAAQLDDLLTAIERVFGQAIAELPTSVETSPATATVDRLQVLASHGVQRISLGVQSFSASETRRLGRPQLAEDVHQALGQIRACGFPELNIDLIYGAAEQTLETWLASLLAALEYQPEELYLYPLYVRPQTGLGRQMPPHAGHRTDLYAAARDLLGEHGYIQTSLRAFRLPRAKSPSSYACQRDGMIGLGCGARSYTRRLHYATRFAATQAGIQAILGEWVAQSDQQLALATHGIWLSADEQARRYAIMSLLQAEGISLAEFRKQFPGYDFADLSGVADLIDHGWLTQLADRYVLTPLGLQNSDIVGPLMYSPQVLERLRSFVESAPILAAPTPM